MRLLYRASETALKRALTAFRRCSRDHLSSLVSATGTTAKTKTKTKTKTKMTKTKTKAETKTKTSLGKLACEVPQYNH